MTWPSCATRRTIAPMAEPGHGQSLAGAVVRTASPGDAAAIARVHVDTWRSTYAGLLPDTYLVKMSLTRRAAYWSEVLRRRSSSETVLVASLQTVGVVGFLSFGLTRNGGWPKPVRRYGEIYTLYVETDYQGSGLGRLLLEDGLRRVRDSGRPGTSVWVLDGNPSRFFYSALGARQVTERVVRFAGVAVRELGFAWKWGRHETP